MKRLLLISNSTQWGRGYLDHVEAEIRAFLRDACRVGFVPFALFDQDAYTAKVRARCQPMGFDLRTVRDRFDDFDAIFVGGGNTFRLLKALQDRDLVEPIRRRVLAGMPYVGSSAGSIVAAPSLKTTKDMPIVQPRSFDALGLVDFQISPHFQDPDPNSTHMGETQEERILQFLEENETPVLGMLEGAWVVAGNGSVT